MNYLAHVAVALACDLTTNDKLLGAVLPDLSGMSRVRFDRELLPPTVGLGIACHYATDTAFHSHPAFIAGSAQIRRQLASDGLDTGPRRAVAHIGWELMLDGSVAVLPNVVESFTAAVSAAETVAGPLSVDERTRWTAFTHEMLRGRDWNHYGDPSFVAARVRLILLARPRLALREDDMHYVLRALDDVGGSIADVSASIVSDVAAAVLASDSQGYSSEYSSER